MSAKCEKITFSETDGKDGNGNRKEKEGLTLGEMEWNMRGVLRLKGSLLKFMEGDTAGVTSPIVYISMLFSSFAWHVEDHDFVVSNTCIWELGRPVKGCRVMRLWRLRMRFTSKYLSQMERPEGQEETWKSYVVLAQIDDYIDDVEPHRRIMDRFISEKLTRELSELP
ncbi:hypothetical protein Tco_0834718 [Tanacetum coccineum]